MPDTPLFRLREAGADAFETLWPMVVALNAEDGHPVRDQSAQALKDLLATPAFGKAYLIELVKESNPKTVGYCIVTFGYSIELGGRDMLIDEIYITPEMRGTGLGRAAMVAVESRAREMGFASVFLEVMRGNRAKALYRSLGYAERDSLFLGKSLLNDDGPETPPA